MDIYEQLEELGLKRKPASAYLALLKLQKANAHQIAKEANIERTTIYNIMEELVTKQLVTKSLKGKRLSYIIEPPIRFQNMILKQKGILEKLMPILAAMEGHSDIKPTVKYYESRNGVGKAMMESLNSKEKLRRDFASVKNILEFLGEEFINRYIKERVKRGIHLRSLRSYPENKAETADWFLRAGNTDVLREVRYLNKSVKIEPLIIIYDDVVTVISSKKESFALIIKSPEMAQAMKTLFDLAWSISKKAGALPRKKKNSSA